MKVILIVVSDKKDFNYEISEMKNLVKACDFEVFECVTQRLSKIDSKHYIGSGKLEEVKKIAEENEIANLIIAEELTGSQIRNIEKYTECRVIDRTQLILEIFARRAKSKEAKLQVSIAQLNYQKTRMIGSYEGLDRQGGGGFGTVARGSGETKLETDRRVIERQISLYEKELVKFSKTRSMQRSKRKGNEVPVVAVVGYTNVGKSTLMNALVKEEKEVFEKNMLFATLDTAVRNVELENGLSFLMVDTVGFVSKLPHDLIKAFRSTLEEIEEADLIVHLCDYSSNEYESHKEVVESTLKNLDVEHIPLLIVNNKIDMVEEYNDVDLGISAKNGINIETLLNILKEKLFSDYKYVKIEIPFSKSNVISQISELCKIANVMHNDDKTCFTAILNEKQRIKYGEFIKEVT